MKHIKLFENFVGGCKDNCEEIIGYIVNNSSFILSNDKHEDVLIFTTKDHGNTSTETHSDIDYQEGLNLIKNLKGIFDGFEYSIHIVDEWVDINVKKLDYYTNYEPPVNKVGYILTAVKSDETSYNYYTDKGDYRLNRENNRKELKRLCERFIKEKTPEEVLEIVDSLPIDGNTGFSEKVLIQKKHNKDDDYWITIPNADFYISRREIW